jgi:hypothetical protein
MNRKNINSIANKLVLLLLTSVITLKLNAQEPKIYFHTQDENGYKNVFYDQSNNKIAEFDDNFVETKRLDKSPIRDCYKSIENKCRAYEARAYVDVGHNKYERYIVDEKGKIIKNLGKKFEIITQYINGFFLAYRPIEGKKGSFMISYLDKNGNNAFGEKEFWEAEPFSDGQALIQEKEKEKWYFINEKGEKVIDIIQSCSNENTKVADIQPFINGFSKIKLVDLDENSKKKNSERYIYIDKKGNIVKRNNKIEDLIECTGGYFKRFGGDKYNGYSDSLQIFDTDQNLLHTFKKCYIDIEQKYFQMRPYIWVCFGNLLNPSIYDLKKKKLYELNIKVEGVVNSNNIYFIDNLIVFEHTIPLYNDCVGAKNAFTAIDFTTNSRQYLSKLDNSLAYFYNCRNKPNIEYKTNEIESITFKNYTTKHDVPISLLGLKRVNLTYFNPYEQNTEDEIDGIKLILKDDFFVSTPNIEELNISMQKDIITYTEEEDNIKVIKQTFMLPSSIAKLKKLKKLTLEDGKFDNLIPLIEQLPNLELIEVRLPNYFDTYKQEIKEKLKKYKNIKFNIYES